MGACQTVVGIDPGASGAIALIDRAGGRVAVWDMPTKLVGVRKKRRVVDNAALALLLFREVPEKVLAAIETVNSMPQEGVASAFSFGRAYGVALGVVCGLGMPMVEVEPQAWKKFHGLIKKDKEASRLLAIERFPVVKVALARKKDHGRAEALLIADYVMRR